MVMRHRPSLCGLGGRQVKGSIQRFAARPRRGVVPAYRARLRAPHCRNRRSPRLAQGGRGVYVRAQRGSLPPRASDMLAVRIRAIDGEGLSPSRFAASPAATGAFTSWLPTGRSPFPPLDMTTTSTGLLCRRDLHPLEWQLASLHLLIRPPARACRMPLTERGPGSHFYLKLNEFSEFFDSYPQAYPRRLLTSPAAA
jgi:hypothetical protein